MNTHEAKAGQPLIAILMAVYEPRLDWLAEQLDSLEAQTWPNLRLYIRDDCSTRVPFEAIGQCVREHIRKIPYVLNRNEANLGSNGTFERLTREAEGDWFAYCDQDDVWLPEKLSTLAAAIEAHGAKLVCSDMLIIDGHGRQTADSITAIRKRHVFKSGEGLAQQLLVSNFATGCTVLVDAKEARAAVPFCPYMVHDHYLALWCAERGKIVSLPDRLIRYRVHAENQTLVMAGVVDKASYVDVRVRLMIDRLTWLRDYFPCGEETARQIERGLQWAQARERNFDGQLSAKLAIWRSRDMSPAASLFEIVASGLPNGLFMRLVDRIRG